MRILVTGATGFLGYRVVEQLAKLTHVENIVATGRVIKRQHHITHQKVDYVLGDLVGLEFVKSVVKDVDYIIHAAALSSPWGLFEDFEKANLISQKNIISAARQSSVKRIVFISTPSLYFDNTDRLNIRESDPLPEKFINAYAYTKRQAEIELEKSSIPYVILRPRALIGRGDTVIMPRLIRANKERKLKIIGNGNNQVDLTSVANVVDAILLSLKISGKGLNETYNISNGESVKLWEQIIFVLQMLDHKIPTKRIPYFIAQTVARLMEWKSKMTNMKEPALTVYSIGTLTKSFTMDISKAKKLLGYEPRVSTKESILEFIKWYKENEKG
jgi:nucleoside-diphosphate-sugar epimerase